MDRPISAVLAEKQDSDRVHAVAPDTTVEDAVRQMNEHRIGSVAVMDGPRLVGIFTERDVLVRVVAAKRDAATTRVADVMSAPVKSIKADTTVRDTMRVMTGSRLRHLPVLDGGKVVGLVSIGDLTKWLVRDQQVHIDDLERYITTG